MKHNSVCGKAMTGAGKIMLLPLCFILALLLMSIVQAWWPRASSWSETVKVALSWPVLVVILLSCSAWLFEEPIRKFLSEVRHIEAPPGWRISRQQERGETKEAADFISTATLSEIISQRDSQWQGVLQAERLAAAATVGRVHGEMSSQLAQARLESLMWRFRYAHVYLARSSRAVLSWFGQVGGVTREIFEGAVEPFIPDPRERQAILDALSYVGFIRFDGSTFSITEEGRLFLQVAPPVQ